MTTLIMNKYWLIAIIVFMSSTNVTAVELATIGTYADSGTPIQTQGYSLSNKSGGLGIGLTEAFFDERLELTAAYQYGVSGDANAAFAGASVSGPADLTTKRVGASYYLYPKASLTPFLYLGRLTYDGDIEFTGTRGTAAVAGSATVKFNRQETAIGARYSFDSSRLTVQYGSAKWDMASNAVGTLGALRVITSVSTSNTDPYWRIGYRNQLTETISASVNYSSYQLTADNKVDVSDITARLSYAF
jgi:hypothetical protein